MAPTRGTPTRPIRIETGLWDRFGEVAEPDRSTVLREFIRWYVHDHGARMPKRPAKIAGYKPGTDEIA